MLCCGCGGCGGGVCGGLGTGLTINSRVVVRGGCGGCVFVFNESFMFSVVRV